MATSIFLLLLIFFITGIFLRLDFVFYIAYLLIGVFLLARLWTRQSLRALTFHRSYLDHAFLGETIQIDLELQNRSLLPIPWLRIEDVLPIGLSANPLRLALSLRPKERLRLSYEIAGHKRGVYPLGPAILRSGDLFGLEEPCETKEPANQITIYPQILPITELGLPSRSPSGTLRSKERVFQDPARVIGVRDYHPGDSLRHVNWKVSARQNRLQTRVFEPAISLDTVILLNLNRQEYERTYRIDATERAIVVAASVANHLIEGRQAVGFHTNGLDSQSPQGAPLRVPTSPGQANLMRILDVLARVRTADTTPFVSFLQQETAGLPWGVTLLVITGVGDEDLLHELHTVRRRGYEAMLISVEPHMGFPDVRRQARMLGIPAYQVTRLPTRILKL